MKNYQFLSRPLAALMAAAGFLFAAEAIAQQRIEIPELPPIRGGMDMGVIMDSTLFSTGSNMSIQMTVENGVKKIVATENGVKTYIEEDPENNIVIRTTKQYGPEEMDQLMEDHPDLYMSVKDFPAETDGAEAVEVTVGVTRKYEASSPEELKEKHPEVYKVYEKYTAGHNGVQILRGRFGGEILMPEIRITPEFRRGDIKIDPEDVRIHKDPESSKKARKDKDT